MYLVHIVSVINYVDANSNLTILQTFMENVTHVQTVCSRVSFCVRKGAWGHSCARLHLPFLNKFALAFKKSRPCIFLISFIPVMAILVINEGFLLMSPKGVKLLMVAGRQMDSLFWWGIKRYVVHFDQIHALTLDPVVEPVVEPLYPHSWSDHPYSLCVFSWPVTIAPLGFRTTPFCCMFNHVHSVVSIEKRASDVPMLYVECVQEVTCLECW